MVVRLIILYVAVSDKLLCFIIFTYSNNLCFLYNPMIQKCFLIKCHVRFMSVDASVKLYCFLCHSYDSIMNMFGQVKSGEELFFFFSKSRFFKISWIMQGNKLCRTRQRNKGKGVASASNQRQQIPSEKQTYITHRAPAASKENLKATVFQWVDLKEVPNQLS